MFKRKSWTTALIIAGLLVYAAAFQAAGWHAGGHNRATSLALKTIEGRVPEFFTEGARSIVHFSVDPDNLRPRQLPQLRNAVYPEHYFDVELLKGEAVPDTRYEFYALCNRLEVAPYSVGTLPYAVAEWTQRLAVAFAEHRRWPDDPDIRFKCLLYAGMLAHYAQDMCQPLHLTIHFDGRVGEDGRPPHAGIHEKVDALLQKLDMDDEALLEGVETAAFENLMEAIRNEIESGFALVDRVYELEAGIPGAADPIEDQATLQFTVERMRTAAKFTASLYLTAWELSADENLLPGWHTR